MNLTDAKLLLEKHGYILTEFLNKSNISLYSIFSNIGIKFGEKFEEIDYGIYHDYTSPEGDEFKSDDLIEVYYNTINATNDQLNDEFHKYGYHLRSVNKNPDGGSIYHIERINNDIIYANPTTTYLHISEAPPKIIEKTGLRCKNKSSKFDKGMNVYGKRIYLSIPSARQLNNIYSAIQEFDEYQVDHNINEDDLIYYYLIKLPKTFPLHKDPEYPKDKFYTYQSIPSKYISYYGKLLNDIF